MIQAKSEARRKLVAGNWKMNGLRASGEGLTAEIVAQFKMDRPACDVVLCPPATLLMAVSGILAGSGIGLGGQDCHAAASGAHTGDISATMLQDLGCGFVIVGHSERRANHGETDSMVRDKASAALAAGLTPIICVGETEKERASGTALDVVKVQVERSLPSEAPNSIVIAYEPIWAIGSGRIPTLEEIIEMHADIRSAAAPLIDGGGDAIRILYGGSVKASNAAEVLGLEGVDGALVGGASLQAKEFWAIIEAAA